MTEKNIVWILGAGFSHSLGVPLLRRLLSKSNAEFLKATYQANSLVINPAADVVWNVYHRFSPAGGGDLWQDAEEFLAFLDDATSRPGHPKARLLESIDPFEVGLNEIAAPAAILEAARRLVAAECCAPFEFSDTGDEKWGPYTRWSRALSPHDTIVTFNYDSVLERLRQDRLDHSLSDLMIATEEDDLTAWSEETVPKALKLHGSVTWEIAGAPPTVQVGALDCALKCAPEALAIATPGRNKAGATKLFAHFWKRAAQSILEADAIVVIGYSFPRTDIAVRNHLLAAIVENKRPQLMLHLVLGESPDVPRLEYLLEQAMQNAGRVEKPETLGDRNRLYAVRSHPFLAEEFLGFVPREQLLLR